MVRCLLPPRHDRIRRTQWLKIGLFHVLVIFAFVGAWSSKVSLRGHFHQVHGLPSQPDVGGQGRISGSFLQTSTAPPFGNVRDEEMKAETTCPARVASWIFGKLTASEDERCSPGKFREGGEPGVTVGIAGKAS